ncbi:MAG: hypothetical protein GTO00_09190 [Deltaproteobacteria bacterium]|nr:hypothetical protein [Deltaproteobacteria bacterium]
MEEKAFAAHAAKPPKPKRDKILDAKAKDSPAKRIAHDWFLTKVTMVLQETECLQCHSVWRMPMPQLYVTRYNERKRVVETTAKPYGLIPPHIERHVEVHNSFTAEACPNCFSGADHDAQLRLFDPRLAYEHANELPTREQPPLNLVSHTCEHHATLKRRPPVKGNRPTYDLDDL